MDITLASEIMKYFEDSKIICPHCQDKWKKTGLDCYRLFVQLWGGNDIKVICFSKCGFVETVPIRTLEELYERYEKYKTKQK